MSNSDELPGPSGLGSVAKFSSPKKKRTKKSAMSSLEKTVLINIYKLAEETWPKNEFIYRKDIARKTAETAGVSLSTVYNVLAEYKNEKRVHSPTPAPKRVTKIDLLDELDLSGIRRKFHEFFFRNEPPSLSQVLQTVNDDETLPNFKRTTFQKLIKKLDIKYLKRSRKSMLIEKSDIVRWRFDYLTKIIKFREEKRKIYYLDETWLNEGHTKSKVWQDVSVQSSREAHREGLSTGLTAPTGKGKRLIILHIGSDDGFLNGGELIFESKKGEGDYHQEMNSKIFEDWFMKIINKIEPNSIVVMDNAPYHSRRLEKVPTMVWLKTDIQKWLNEKGIPFETNMLKRNLMDLVKKEKNKYMAYVIDTYAKNNNIEILRLPPYHCELNPIEMIWGQVKGYVAGKNKSFKMADLKILLREAMDLITPATWQKCIKHVIKEELKMAQLDHLSDTVADQFIIHVTEDSTTSTSGSSSDSD